MPNTSIGTLSGFMPAVPTPFTVDDRIDFVAFEHFCDLQVRDGATALVVCGTTGEAPTLSDDEYRELIAAACQVARGRVPVIAGAGSNATAHAIALSRAAQTAGADALLSVVPYYNKPTQAGIQAHFRAIADSVGLPIILYDVPSRAVVSLADATVAQLAAHPLIVGLKDATGDISRCERLRPLVPERFRLLSGDDATAPALLAQGGDGCISVTSNIAPGLCRVLYDELTSCRLTEAHRLARPFAALTAALTCSVNPVPIKYALSLFGLMSPHVRLPLVELDAQHRDEVARVCRKLIDFGTSLSIAAPNCVNADATYSGSPALRSPS